jgi:hypothetical protein
MVLGDRLVVHFALRVELPFGIQYPVIYALWKWWSEVRPRSQRTAAAEPISPA